MKGIIKKILLFVTLLCLVTAISACSSKQNGVTGQQEPSTQAALSQSDSGNQTDTGNQPNDQAGQEQSGSQPASTQPKNSAGDNSQSGSTDKPGRASEPSSAGQVKPEDKSGIPANALVHISVASGHPFR